MNFKKLLALVAVFLCFGCVISEATAKKTSMTKRTAKKTSVKATKKRAITPNSAFYDKLWDKFKVGSKADKADAISVLKKIIKTTPKEFMAYYYLGIMEADVGKGTEALKYYSEALAGFPTSSDIHIRMAQIYDEKGKGEDALAHYRQALAMDEENPKALSKCGIAELEKGNIEKASEYLTKARDLEPDNSDTLRALGQAWFTQGKYSEAIEILEQVLLFDAKDAKAHLFLGKAYEKSGNNERAVSHIELASKYGKKDASIAEAVGYDIARNLARIGKYEEAISAYKKEIKKNENPALGCFEMGQVFDYLEQYSNAVKAYKKAFELNKKYAQGVFRSAEIYYEKKDKENMQNMLKLIKNNPDYKDRVTAMLDDYEQEEELAVARKLEEEQNSRGSKDADLEASYLESYESDKKDAEVLEKLYLYYKERGYYDEALKWFRKYAKAGSVSDYDKKSVEKELKAYFEQDNYYLFGDKSEDKPGKSKIPDDELMNLAFNGENDRQKEVAFSILLARKDYKENRNVIEGALKFYEERGRVKEATKYINKLKNLGYLSESEAKAKKEKLRD